MTDSSQSYLRYVVVEVPGPAVATQVRWLGRAATAAEGFGILEQCIAEQLACGRSKTRVALVDCNEHRVLGWYADSPPLDGMVARVVDYARGFAGGSPAPGSRPAPPAASSSCVSQPTTDTDLDEPVDGVDPSLQPLIDAFVREYYACRVNKGLYDSVCDNLEDANDPCDFDDEPLQAVTRSALIEVLSLRSPEEVRDALGRGPGKRLGAADWITYVVEVELPTLLEDEEASRMIGPVLLRDSYGRSLSMIKSLTGGFGGDVQVQWHGARATWADFLRELGRDWFTSPDDFSRLPLAEQRRIVLEARKR
ncbi:MAG TPA: hypothetical protein VGD77_11780 [Gemmatimonadaceae bacterium]